MWLLEQIQNKIKHEKIKRRTKGELFDFLVEAWNEIDEDYPRSFLVLANKLIDSKWVKLKEGE